MDHASLPTFSHELVSAPSSDPLTIYRYRDSLYAADLVSAALGLDFFTWLADHPASVEEICAHFGFCERPVDTMLTLFAANGWVRREGKTFHASLIACEHLTSRSVWNLRPYYASLHERPIARDFLQVLKTDKPAGWSGDHKAFDWHKAMEQEDFARGFTAAMDCRGLYLSEALARALPLADRSCVLDIGAGSGVYACAIVARHPHLRAVAFDQAPVDQIASTKIAERGCAERVSVVQGNMFEKLPEGCDVHLFSNVLHDWGVAEVRSLLRRSREALPPGGLLVIHDAFINESKDGPLHVAEYSCLLMHSTQGKCYSTGEYAQLLADAGFEPGPYRDTVVARGFMTAIRH